MRFENHVCVQKCAYECKNSSKIVKTFWTPFDPFLGTFLVYRSPKLASGLKLHFVKSLLVLCQAIRTPWSATWVLLAHKALCQATKAP